MLIQSLLDSSIKLDPGRRVHIRMFPQKCRIWTGRTGWGSNQVKYRSCRLQRLWETEGQVVNFVLVNFALPVQLIPGSTLELSLGLPRDPGNTPQVPSDQNEILGRLPNPKHLKWNVSKQDSAVESQSPEYQFVLLNSIESVYWVDKGNVIPAQKLPKKLKQSIPEQLK